MLHEAGIALLVICLGSCLVQSVEADDKSMPVASACPRASSGGSLIQRQVNALSSAKAADGFNLPLAEVPTHSLVMAADTEGTIADAMSGIVMPKVIQSRYDKTTLFYHVHIPRTGGSTVAQLMIADICSPNSEHTTPLTWSSFCSKSCEMGLTDNEFSCYPGREQMEHHVYSLNMERAEKLKSQVGATRVAYVTTLRTGSSRLVSQWLKEITAKAWLPPAPIPPYSNQSLQLYINGPNTGGWIMRGCPSQRANLHVAQLASLNTPNFQCLDVTRAHLEQAKKVLLTGEWIIGFTTCMDDFQTKLETWTAALHGNITHKEVPPRPANNHVKHPVLDQETEDMLDKACSLDNELFEWAWMQSVTFGSGPNSRFAGTC